MSEAHDIFDAIEEDHDKNSAPRGAAPLLEPKELLADFKHRAHKRPIAREHDVRLRAVQSGSLAVAFSSAAVCSTFTNRGYQTIGCEKSLLKDGLTSGFHAREEELNSPRATA